ncbi:Hsp20/alpha crystallin family protein [Coraliomargarita parva]|uniref:Hsp20/alpha crystallin family protein n=1 Tax=Coraliomargarita parva TaxID=3014050 RepID=UPI0022B4ACCE|nr:Hsp20/alpha crystallin family protein [Coraliomargarita parva]
MSTEVETTNKAEVSKAAPRKWRRPQYRVSEHEDAFEVAVTMPGVGRTGLDISLEGETLSIRGTRLHPSTASGWRPLRRELPEGDYRLELRLNVLVNENKIRAEMADGILRLTLPKADEVKARKIKVG